MPCMFISIYVCLYRLSSRGSMYRQSNMTYIWIKVKIVTLFMTVQVRVRELALKLATRQEELGENFEKELLAVLPRVVLDRDSKRLANRQCVCV